MIKNILITYTGLTSAFEQHRLTGIRFIFLTETTENQKTQYIKQSCSDIGQHKAEVSIN